MGALTQVKVDESVALDMKLDSVGRLELSLRAVPEGGKLRKIEGPGLRCPA